jgi:hypothetical protein
MSSELPPQSLRHPWVTWKAHAWWAALILVPFLVPHAVMSIRPSETDVTATLVLYGPVIASLWIAGHVVLCKLHRSRVAEPVFAGA